MMKTSIAPARRLVRGLAVLALGCAFNLASAQTSGAKATDAATLQPLADEAAKLPVTATFAKAEGDSGPYVLTVKNDSSGTLKVSAKVLLSVVHHSAEKARNVPEHAIAAGEAWTISELAAQDKVILSAEGYAPLELVVK